MTYLRTMLIAVVALSLGALLGGPAQAQLGNGGNAIGSVSEAIAGAAGAAGDLAGPRVGSESVSRISTQAQCDANKIRIRTETDYVSTTSISYVNMPNSARLINVGANGCIIVTFTGLFLSQATNSMLIRAGIHGGPIAEPPFIAIGRPAHADYYTHTMQFVFTNLPAGNHAVHLFFQSNLGTEIRVWNRMMKYEYR